MARIGFIGVGKMGGPMARNLMKAGHTVTAFDIAAPLLDAAIEAGAVRAASVRDCVADAEIVITMLPAGHHVRDVYLADEGVLKSAGAGALLIDCSTIDVETARSVAAAASEAGFEMLDAPVSGGVGGAEAGTLTFMVGGAEGAFERARPLLEAMGRNIVHCGGAGNGQCAKMCNNMILAISMIGVGEAFVLAEKLGLDHQKLFDVSSTASGQCWALNSYCPVPGPVPSSPANRDYQAGFTADMMLKDLRLAQNAAQSFGASTPLGSVAQALYAMYVNGGEGSTDFSGIIRMIRGERS